jgi:light-regulated signal transduction histidine kinase (bacteriophytochrome)
MIGRVLVNLLENASKFSPSQSTIQMGAEIPEKAPTQVRFWVKDSGPGIAPEDQQRIFEKFTPAGRTKDQRPGNRPGFFADWLYRRMVVPSASKVSRERAPLFSFYSRNLLRPPREKSLWKRLPPMSILRLLFRA